MKQRVVERFGKMVCGLAGAAVLVVLVGLAVSPAAFAQSSSPAPAAASSAPALPVPQPPVPAVPVEAAADQAPVLVAPAPASLSGSDSDHDGVVGRWGVEARQLGSFRRTAGQDAGCAEPCAADLNALGVRRWISQHYGYSAGLAIAAGGGSRRINGSNQTFDTYFGVGPTVAAHFLVANWKHLAVNLSPQLDAVFFLPSSSGRKSILINVRSVVEGELHLGMIGLPAASVGISTGLTGSFLKVTNGSATPAAGTAAATADTTSARWSIGVTGPQALWDLVTKATLRYYF